MGILIFFSTICLVSMLLVTNYLKSFVANAYRLFNGCHGVDG
jgi:hypothetical protein